MGPTALVLAGGGSRGAYEIGVWRALGELDERFQIVTGTSVGAINGAVIAQGDFETAEQLWKELETSRVFDLPLDESLPAAQKLWEAVRLFGRAALREGGAGTAPLEGLLRRYIDEDAVRRSPIDFGMVTIDISAMKPLYLWKSELPRGRLIDYLIASSALFPAVRPQVIDGRRYIDGGYSDNLPIRMAIDRGAQRIIAVHMDALGVVRRDKNFQNYEIRLIRSYWDLGVMLFFDPVHARQNLRLGYLDTMRAYGIFDGYAFTFEKGTLAGVVRRYYASFYADLELLGFHSVRRRFLDSVAYRAVEKQVFRRGIPAAQVRGFALEGMESAAELLGLSPGTVYTFSRLCERLRESLAQTELPAQLGEAALLEESTLNTLGAALELAERPARIKFLAKCIRGCILRQQPLNLLPVAALMANEFFAAYFLAATNLI